MCTFQDRRKSVGWAHWPDVCGSFDWGRVGCVHGPEKPQRVALFMALSGTEWRAVETSWDVV